MMFNRILSKLKDLLTAKQKDSPAPIAPLTVAHRKPVFVVAAEEEVGSPLNQGRNRRGHKARSRDERRASRGTSNKGSRRRELYLALEG